MDCSGSINLKEISAIIDTMDQVEGKEKDERMSCEDTDDETTESGGNQNVGRRAEILFRQLDVDNDGEITMDEFVQGYLRIHEREARLAKEQAAIERARMEKEAEEMSKQNSSRRNNSSARRGARPKVGNNRKSLKSY